MGSSTSLPGSKQRCAPTMRATWPAETCQPWPVEVEVWLGGRSTSRPQCETSIDGESSLGARHAPSSCGKVHRWSAPPERFQYGCAVRTYSYARRYTSEARTARGTRTIGSSRAIEGRSCCRGVGREKRESQQPPHTGT